MRFFFRMDDGTSPSQLRSWRSNDRHESPSRGNRMCGHARAGASANVRGLPRKLLTAFRPSAIVAGITRSCGIRSVVAYFAKLLAFLAGKLFRRYAIRAPDRTERDRASGGSSSSLKHFCRSFNLDDEYLPSLLE